MIKTRFYQRYRQGIWRHAVLILVLMTAWSVAFLARTEASPAVTWQPCPGAPTTPPRECAVIQVPMDYNDPGRGSTELQIARARASDPDPSKHMGALLVLPGGPPSTGVSFVGYAANLNRSVPVDVQKAYDLIGIQQIGSWNGVPCMSGDALKEYWEVSHLPSNTTELHRVMGLEERFNEGCTDPQNALVPHMNTARSIRDIEIVRQVLDLERFNLLAFSYGTALAHGYMSMYPQHTGRAVLDSIVDRSLPDLLHDKENNVAFDESWGYFKEWCNGDNACPLQGQKLDSLFDQALHAAKNGGIPAPRNPFGAGQLNEWELTVALQALTGAGEATYIWAATVLKDAAAGDGSQGDFLYDLLTGRRPDGSYVGGDGTRRAYSCNDSVWSRIFTEPQHVRLWAEATGIFAPRYGQALVYQGAAQCYKWTFAPVETRPLWQPVSSPASKALLISATRDASTPLKWAKRVQWQLPGSRMVVLKGASHLQISRSRCAANYAAQYLLTGALPADKALCNYDPDFMPPQLPPDLDPLAARWPSELPAIPDKVLSELRRLISGF